MFFFLFSPSSASATPDKWNTDQQEYAVSHARRCADLFVSLLSPRCSQVITDARTRTPSLDRDGGSTAAREGPRPFEARDDGDVSRGG